MKEEIRKRLLKKRRGILTRYTKLAENGFYKVRRRGMTRITTDCRKNAEHYLTAIENAKRIIKEYGGDNH